MTVLDGARRVLPVLVALTGCAGSEPPDDTDTAPPVDEDGSVSAVIPNVVYPHRTVDVTISGSATGWTSSATVDFGDGITVIDQTVASPTAIVARVDVSRNAALGVRDVVVTHQSTSYTYAGAFEVRAPIELAVYGTQAQGSLVYVEAFSLDPTTPFDPAQYCDDFGCFYVNMDATFDLSGLTPEFSVVGPTYAELLVLIDVDAETGPSGILLESGPQVASVVSDAPDALDVIARTPKALAEGANPGAVAEPFGSEVWSLDPGSALAVDVSVTTGDDGADPEISVLDSTGSWLEGFLDYGYGTEFVPDAGPYYVIVWDAFGDEAYDYSVEVDLVEPEADDACDTVAAATPMPIADLEAAFSNATDEDWYRIALDESAVGGRLHVATAPGDSFTDPLIEVWRGSCDGLSLFYQSDVDAFGDPEWHEDVTTPAIDDASGDWYVVVRSNENFYSRDNQRYVLDVEVVTD